MAKKKGQITFHSLFRSVLYPFLSQLANSHQFAFMIVPPLNQSTYKCVFYIHKYTGNPSHLQPKT